MQPTLQHGQTVLVDVRAFVHGLPHPDDLVLAEHPRQPGIRVIKRVGRIEGERIVLTTDNPDARTWGPEFGVITPRQVFGRVECTFP